MVTTTRDLEAANAAPIDSLAKAFEYLAELQHPTGYWEAEMVWNSMLLSQWVITQKIVGRLERIPDDQVTDVNADDEMTTPRDKIDPDDV